MIDKKIVKYLGYWGIKVTPYMVIKSENLDIICDNKVKIRLADGFSLTHGGPPYECTKNTYDNMFAEYQGLRNNLLQILGGNAYSVEEFMKYEEHEQEDVSP